MGTRPVTHINDLRHLVLQLTGVAQNHNGRFWIGTHNNVVIPAGGTFYFAMTFADAEVELIRFTVETDAVDGSATYYEGGSYSGGTPLVFESMNRITNDPVPAADGKAGVTIDSAGINILDFKVRGSSGIFGGNVFGGIGQNTGIIFRPNTVYYFEIINNDGSSRNFDFVFEMTKHED